MSSFLSPSLSSPFIYDSATTRHGINLFPFPHTTASPAPRCFKSFSVNCSLDNIPKQFRQENLKDGVMENFKNVPQYLYGLPASQMHMFMEEDNPISRQSERVKEESISSAKCYLDYSGMGGVSSKDNYATAKYTMSSSAVYRGGRAPGRRRGGAPPDLPSVLLDGRIVYLGMPIVPAVTELLLGQFMWLDYDNRDKPIYLYINSSGTQNEKNENVGSETDAYTIADMIFRAKSKVYTVNLGMAFGQAAMLLAIGKKGYRAVLPNSATRLYLPKLYKSSGCVADMWIKAKELETNTKSYIELLAKGTRKSQEVIAKDLARPKFFLAQAAIDYGLADRIMVGMESAPSEAASAFDKRNNELGTDPLKRQSGGNPRVAPSGLI